MSRPKANHPTPTELEVLQILWDQGPLPVRAVWAVLQDRQQPPAYTSVLSLLTVMADKGLLQRESVGRALEFRANVTREQTVGTMLSDLWRRAFSGSTSALVAHLLDQTQPSEAELQAIRDTIQKFEDSTDPKAAS